ncbi:putative adenosine monophosphate-protein transferase aq aa38 [Marine Group I thaumarchaeote SCGC AAA799-N04]|uniref:Putative adenosine monophosphate-protein transferase aq aa38 n=2 Tax=Marine Group I TaxID=905826 RepID=A0A081RMX1_9ARCH|nr:putative adenosine monophosphate-protein transferase aq aa38 [Marine Group I thaumarchaeote SCGC AAA799-N04]
MVSLIKRKENGKIKYYLKYSSRNTSAQKYLGTAIPKDLKNQMKFFEIESYRKDKYGLLEKIHQNYLLHTQRIDKKILANEFHGFKINHTYSTQKIEGSTMTLGQTRKLLETGLSPQNTSIEDIVEAQQLGAVFDLMLSYTKDISEKLILSWHEILFEKTDTNNAGTFRRQDVQPYLGKTEYVLWDEVQEKIRSLIKWYASEKKKLNPVELSARFHNSFELIHPFIDGNGRIGRLLMIFILHKNNYPMVNITPKEKQTYINKLESSYMKNDEMVFVKWFVSKYLRDNKKFLK